MQVVRPHTSLSTKNLITLNHSNPIEARPFAGSYGQTNQNKKITSITEKYRPSSIEDREGSIYYQIIHDRIVRQLSTDYHVFTEEWDASRSMVTIVGHDSERKSLILSIREQIRWDVERLTRIDKKLDTENLTYSADDIVDEFKRYKDEYSLFNFMERLIIKLKQNGKIRTSETYTATLKSFKKFRKDEDLMLDCLTSEIMEAYEAWHKNRGNSYNTISFYTRILRAAYNRAAEEEIIENRNPFRRVYTGIDKTVKRAIPLHSVKRIKALDLSSTPMLDYARDMFVMSFMLRGMSFIDMTFLCRFRNEVQKSAAKAPHSFWRGDARAAGAA